MRQGNPKKILAFKRKKNEFLQYIDEKFVFRHCSILDGHIQKVRRQGAPVPRSESYLAYVAISLSRPKAGERCSAKQNPDFFYMVVNITAGNYI